MMLVYIPFIALSFTATSRAETHAITFTNNCGHGTPALYQGGQLLNGNSNQYTANGPLSSAIVFLQTGTCSTDGDHCTMLELNLANGGNGATSADITLIPDHTFTDAIGFKYTSSNSSSTCAGTGAACAEESCDTAYHVSSDSCALVNCSEDDIGIDITFCGVTTGFTPPKSDVCSVPASASGSGTATSGTSTSTQSGSGSLVTTTGTGAPTTATPPGPTTTTE